MARRAVRIRRWGVLGGLAAAAWLVPTVFLPPLNADESEALDELRAGKNFIPTPVHTLEDDLRILALFEGLRVADVCDGMDKVGLQDVGLVSPDVRPLWRDTEHFQHRLAGIAVTVRYVPTNKPPLPRIEDTAEFDRVVKTLYAQVTPEPFTPILRKGSVLVIENAEASEASTIGSNNILNWVSRGCVGVVTNAVARDTDEIVTQRVPLYYKQPGRGVRPGRNEVESVNRPVVIGGVTVIPGDVVVADGDGVIVVPRGVAEEVAAYARKILDGDKAGRRKLYEKLGLPMDETVK